MYCVSLNYKLAGCLAYWLQKSTLLQIQQCLLSTSKRFWKADNCEMTLWIIQIVFVTPSVGYLQLLITCSGANSGRVILYQKNLTDDLQSNEIPLSSDLPLLYPHRCVLTYSAGTSALINCFPYLFRERMYSHSAIKISITFQRTESLV